MILVSFNVSANELNLFCSSGGFSYTYLEVKELEDKIHFHAYGYSLGFDVNNDILQIPSNVNIKFSVEKSKCNYIKEQLPSMRCKADSLSIFSKEKENQIKTIKVNSVYVDLTESIFNNERKTLNFLVTADDQLIIRQGLALGCAELTGL